jgi:hypothetical protein
MYSGCSCGKILASDVFHVVSFVRIFSAALDGDRQAHHSESEPWFERTGPEIGELRDMARAIYRRDNRGNWNMKKLASSNDENMLKVGRIVKTSDLSTVDQGEILRSWHLTEQEFKKHCTRSL